MKILHINRTDIKGGAAIAAYRIHKSLVKEGVDSKMLVSLKYSKDDTVIGPESLFRKIVNLLKPHIAHVLIKFVLRIKKENVSLYLFKSNLIGYINNSDADLVHMHTIGTEFIRLEEIRQINKPIVFTLHDMNIFLGYEHYRKDFNYKEGFDFVKEPVNWLVYQRKLKSFNENIHLVTPSTWLLNSLNQSPLFIGNKKDVIKYPIDLDLFKKYDRMEASILFNLDLEKVTILFGAANGYKDKRKGFEYFEFLVNNLKESVQFVSFGSLDLPSNLNIINIGPISDELKLAKLYSFSDIFVCTSIMDNFPNTVIEATSCGTPTIAFNFSGLVDMVDHGKTGYLVDYKSENDLLFHMKLYLSLTKLEREQMSANCIDYARSMYDEKIISSNYINVYSKLLN